MKTITITDEEYAFLKELQHELNTQETDGNADPVFWGVLEDKEDVTAEGYGVPKIVCEESVYTLKEAVDRIECLLDEDENFTEQRDTWCEVDKGDIDAVADFMENEIGETRAEVIDFVTVPEICRYTGAFLTKRACKKYIENYGYNHNNPRTYAMTAFRNYELENLLNILKNLNFSDSNENKSK